MLRQREPLRVPREWTGEKRGFVMAVERALDGLYKLFGRLRFDDFDKSFQERFETAESTAATALSNTETLDSKKVDKISLTGIRSVGPGGNGGYCKILTIEIDGAWKNYPICIEGISRGRWLSMIQIQFQNVSGTDPGLYGFWSDNDNLIYLHRSAPGVWDLYWRYNENYGNFVVHRILGCGGSTPKITEKYENVSSLPTGSVQAGLWGIQFAKNYMTPDFQEATLNSTYITSAQAYCMRFGPIVVVQLQDVKFKVAIPESAASNSIALFTLPYTLTQGVLFACVKHRAGSEPPLRFKMVENRISPHWTDIPQTSGDGWFGVAIGYIT